MEVAEAGSQAVWSGRITWPNLRNPCWQKSQYINGGVERKENGILSRSIRPWWAQRARAQDSAHPASSSWTYHLKSIWLFTFSDLKTIVGPKTFFGIMNAMAVPVFGIGSAPQPSRVLPRFLAVALWTWINLLPFAIDNQRQPAAIKEDSVNKPWRPLPSKRLTPEQAGRMITILYPIAFLVSIFLGGLKQCIALIVLGYCYNDCGGSDVSWVTRNLINACGFICFSSGAMEVALGEPLTLKPRLVQWFLIIAGVVFSTVQTQDMYDQAGDSLRDRKTMPLVIGDGQARWVTGSAMSVWCVICPWYWKLNLGVSVLFAGFGGTIILRTFAKRSEVDDKRTFRLWNLWMVFVYSLPLIKFRSSA